MFDKIGRYLKNLSEKLFKREQKQLTVSEKRELLIESIDASRKPRAKELRRKLLKPEKYLSIQDWYADHEEFNGILQGAVANIKSSTKIPANIKDGFVTDYSDYNDVQRTPAGTSLYDVFFNPFAIYSYLHKNHPVVFRCMDLIREEIANDGFTVSHYKGVAKKELRNVYQLIKAQDIPRLRLDIATHLKLYGNAWLIKVKDPKNKGKYTLELLTPQRIKPLLNQETGEIVGWRYQRGRSWKDYSLDEMKHLWFFNADAEKKIGDPPLQAALLDIEIDLGIKVYNKQVLEKGFLGSVVFSMETPEGADPWEDNPKEIVEDLTMRINSQLSGASAGGDALVVTGLKDAKNLSPVGNFEGAFTDLSKEKSKIICMCCGVPCERIGINRSESIQYVPSFVEYSVNASFDKSMYCLVGLVDDFLNEVYMKEIHGIYNMKIEAGGRFGSLTKTAADVIKVLADAGPIITVNQALEIILGWEGLPPENPRGNYVLDNTKGRVSGMNSEEVPRYPGIVDPEEDDFDLTTANRQLKEARQLLSDKGISWDKFTEWVHDEKERRDFKSGRYERKDVSHLEDDVIATKVYWKAGRSERYLYEGLAAA